jgi:hypothetical protein
MAKTHDVRFYEGELDMVLNSPQGMVGRHLAKRAYIIETAAKQQVGVQTGRLRNSIKTKTFRTTTGQGVSVGSEVSHALIHHEGSRPHVILPKVQGGKLVFMGGTGGTKLIVTDRVNHPGTRPNRYLSDWLFVAVLP